MVVWFYLECKLWFDEILVPESIARGIGIFLVLSLSICEYQVAILDCLDDYT